jgi:serine/threonine protein kinase
MTSLSKTPTDPQTTNVIPYFGKYNSENDYIKIKELGRGGFAILYSVYVKDHPNCIVAMKVIQKKRLKTSFTKNMIKREINIQSKLLNQHILKFLHHFENDRNHYIILEYAKYGDLFKIIGKRYEDKKYKNRALFSKEECFEIIRQVCVGLKYIHQKGYLHRDLKPDNVLVFEMPPKDKWLVKVSDFGHSHKIKKQKGTFGPTLSYISAEEIGHDKVDVKSEVWKVGVLLYEMVYGILPFDSEQYSSSSDDSERSGSSRKSSTSSTNSSDIVLEKIEAGEYTFPDDINVEKDVKKLIKKCLKVNPKERISIDDIIAYTTKLDD